MKECVKNYTTTFNLLLKTSIYDFFKSEKTHFKGMDCKKGIIITIKEHFSESKFIHIIVQSQLPQTKSMILKYFIFNDFFKSKSRFFSFLKDLKEF